MILAGEFDIDLAKIMAKAWHSEVDNSEYCIIENAGHCANLDMPIEFNELVEKFIIKANNN